MNKKIIATALAVLAPLASQASTPLIAHITKFGIYGNGNVWITLDAATDQPGCSTPYLEFAANSVSNKSILAIAAMATASGAAVLVRVDSCLATGSTGTGTFSGARDGTAFGIDKP